MRPPSGRQNRRGGRQVRIGNGARWQVVATHGRRIMAVVAAGVRGGGSARQADEEIAERHRGVARSPRYGGREQAGGGAVVSQSVRWWQEEWQVYGAVQRWRCSGFHEWWQPWQVAGVVQAPCE